MGEKSETQLFISHHSSKLNVALELEKSLAEYNVTCWLAPRDVEPGEAFDMAIKRAIHESCATLLLFCSQSDKSPHVKRELILADSSRKAILPLRLEKLDPDQLAYHLADSQWIDWMEQRENTIERVAAKAHQLAGTSMKKTMTVDDLIAHGGHDENRDSEADESGPDADAAPRVSAADLPLSEPEPETETADGYEDDNYGYGEPEAEKSVNWAPFVATAALLVALFAAFLFWNNRTSAIETPPDPIVATPEEETGDGPQPGDETPATEAPEEIAAPPKINPSFDCAKAANPVERMICRSIALADLDRTLAAEYKKAMTAVGVSANRLKRQQQAWRTDVRDRCTDPECISRAVRERVAILRAIAAGNLDVPRDRPAPDGDSAFRNRLGDGFSAENPVIFGRNEEDGQ